LQRLFQPNVIHVFIYHGSGVFVSIDANIYAPKKGDSVFDTLRSAAFCVAQHWHWRL
jgi:hypothetical protein